MNQINRNRWLLGGVCAGAVIWLCEGAASMLYMKQMQAALRDHNLSTGTTAASWIYSVLVSLLSGLVLVFFYAASRPRFGPGPRTAVLVAVALWLGGMVVSLIGYKMLGLFSTGMLAQWGALGLIEWILASLLGAKLYREN